MMATRELRLSAVSGDRKDETEEERLHEMDKAIVAEIRLLHQARTGRCHGCTSSLIFWMIVIAILSVASYCIVLGVLLGANEGVRGYLGRGGQSASTCSDSYYCFICNATQCPRAARMNIWSVCDGRVWCAAQAVASFAMLVWLYQWTSASTRADRCRRGKLAPCCRALSHYSASLPRCRRRREQILWNTGRRWMPELLSALWSR